MSDVFHVLHGSDDAVFRLRYPRSSATSACIYAGFVLADTLTRLQTLFFSAAPPRVDVSADNGAFALPGTLAPGLSSSQANAFDPNAEYCPIDQLHCERPGGRVRVLTVPALAIVVFLLFAFLVDLARARLRLRKQLYMPLRHIQVLLTVEVRIQH